MKNFDFFNFERDTKVPAGAIKIGHAINACIYRVEELVTMAGQPVTGGNYTVGQLRSAFAQRWNIASGASAFLRKNNGQSVEVNDSTVVEPGDELEFRAKDGDKGGSFAGLSYGELKKLAKELGLSGKGKKADLVAEITAIAIHDVEGTTLPLNKKSAVTVRIFKAQYSQVRYDRGSANKASIAELAKKYPAGIIERGKIVEYIDEPDGNTVLVAEHQSAKYCGQMVNFIANLLVGGGVVLSASKKEDKILSAGETLQIILK